MLKDLVTVMAKALVDNPDAVDVQEVDGENSSIISLRVAKENQGQVIGKHGQNVQSMRTILFAVADKHKKRAILEIIEQ